MKRKLLSLALALVMCLGLTAVPALAAEDGVNQVTARAGNIDLSLNGTMVKLGTYNIANNNYVKLRDVAQLLNGTEKQFSVDWNGAYSWITLTRGKPYTSVGGELAPLSVGEQSAVPSYASVTVDGAHASMTAYTIRENNFFRLRDLGIALDFYVGWDSGTGTVIVDTSKGYSGGSSDGISDQDLMIQAQMFFYDMQEMRDSFWDGVILPYDKDDVIYVEAMDRGDGIYVPVIIEYNGMNNHYYRVIGYTGRAEFEAALENAWYQRFARKYPLPATMDEMFFHADQDSYGFAEGAYLEYNGAVYTAQRSDYHGGNPYESTVDRLVSRTSDEAVFRGHASMCDSSEVEYEFEYTLVYEDGVWKYGRYSEWYVEP